MKNPFLKAVRAFFPDNKKKAYNVLDCGRAFQSAFPQDLLERSVHKLNVFARSLNKLRCTRLQQNSLLYSRKSEHTLSTSVILVYSGTKAASALNAVI